MNVTRIGIAIIVTLLAFGYVLYEHGEQQDSQAQRHAGLAMLVTAAFVIFWYGLIAVWVWAL